MVIWSYYYLMQWIHEPIKQLEIASKKVILTRSPTPSLRWQIDYAATLKFWYIALKGPGWFKTLFFQNVVCYHMVIWERMESTFTNLSR